MKNQSAFEAFFYKTWVLIKKLPGMSAFARSAAWQIFRFKITLLTSSRRNCHFTKFLRMPSQFNALSGPVFDYLIKSRSGRTLNVAVMGCSTGAEPYSIASVMRSRHPDLVFTVNAYDIDRGCIDKAKSAQYTSEEVLGSELITSDFIQATFDKKNGHYIIKNDIRKHVHFYVADVQDLKLPEKIGTFDIVYVQQLLIHLKQKQAIKGFKNICRLLNPKAALFVAGVELGMLVKLTRMNNLYPCDYNIEEINKEVCMYDGGWPWVYWGREPFMITRRDWKRRYSTIFLKS